MKKLYVSAATCIQKKQCIYTEIKKKSEALRITLKLDCDWMEWIKLIHNGIQLNNIQNTTF